MIKLMQLTLSKIKYGGDSIGDDIRIEVDCLNHSLDVNKTVKIGSTVIIGLPIGQSFTDESSFALPLSIKVIERDVVWNDVGTVEERFVVDTKKSGPQTFASTIEVQETRPYKTKKKATFELTFEATVQDAILYVPFTKQGWFNGTYTTTKKLVDLVSHLQVRLERSTDERDYFRIMEGPLRGERVSLARESGGSRLQQENPHTGPVHLVYSLSKKTVTFGEQVYQVREYKDDPDPWRTGLHDIEIADYSHAKGKRYLDSAALALVWFRVSHHRDKERYLHVGAVSLGCITLIEIERWDELCRILLKARKKNGQSIGTVEIVT